MAQTMSERMKRRRLNDTADSICGRNVSYDSVSEEEKKSWNGFCELESEPVCSSMNSMTFSLTHVLKALFNVMLRNFGVRGVKVQEVVSLDDELLACLK